VSAEKVLPVSDRQVGNLANDHGWYYANEQESTTTWIETAGVLSPSVAALPTIDLPNTLFDSRAIMHMSFRVDSTGRSVPTASWEMPGCVGGDGRLGRDRGNVVGARVVNSSWYDVAAPRATRNGRRAI
jgi:hypothetical protein